MDNLENFPYYDHSVLIDFSFQTIQPVSVTLPYDKALSGSKLIKKKVDKTKGDLVVYSFHHHTKPNVSDGDVLMVELLKNKIDVQVLLSYNHIFKGHRVFSCVCQIQ
ncbi:hypothetical protein ACI0YY_000254 [Cronobacter sakazakii]|uniref:hypothetical protein n=1 Tax=Cronobacter sakazakii TaxID=28141 RepID=UPI0028949035|nr:hypothetical protein [Cronobacter sakazakii]ELQ6225597.1 hypothetical protein [Cronobacter turicensis]ELY5945550.1 hypothetical protein [Cronobacter turicensis]MDT3546914.1 hypothetical protein [Cronobacter sakazakii]MDT3633793.1 hypothetical protein [Cronobacter sakazakii]